MSSQPNRTTAFTVRHIKHENAYHVLNAEGRKVSRYFYDADEFSDRRRAYREALEDAKVRNTVAARQAVNWGSEPSKLSRLDFLYGAQAPMAAQDAEGNVNWGSGPAKAVAL